MHRQGTYDGAATRRLASRFDCARGSLPGGNKSRFAGEHDSLPGAPARIVHPANGTTTGLTARWNVFGAHDYPAVVTGAQGKQPRRDVPGAVRQDCR